MTALSELRWFVTVDFGPPAGLGALGAHGCLSKLNVSIAAVDEWAPELAALTGMQQLRLWLPPAASAEQLAPLSALSCLACVDSLTLGASTLPRFVGSLRQLTSLQLARGQFGEPASLDCLGQLSSLRQLVLRGCGLRRLPPSLSALQGLTHLDLGSNPALRLGPADLRPQSPVCRAGYLVLDWSTEAALGGVQSLQLLARARAGRILYTPLPRGARRCCCCACPGAQEEE